MRLPTSPASGVRLVGVVACEWPRPAHRPRGASSDVLSHGPFLTALAGDGHQLHRHLKAALASILGTSDCAGERAVRSRAHGADRPFCSLRIWLVVAIGSRPLRGAICGFMVATRGAAAGLSPQAAGLYPSRCRRQATAATASAAPPRCVQNDRGARAAMRFFLAGIMQGSHLAATIHNQDYRQRIKQLLRDTFPMRRSTIRWPITPTR